MQDKVLEIRTRELKKEKTKKFFYKDRKNKKLNQTEYGKLLNLKKSAIYSIEANGLLHDLKIYQLLEKLGYDPKSKLEELMK